MRGKGLSAPAPWRTSLADTLFTTSEHAGVPSHPITYPGRFPPGAVSVLREEGGIPKMTSGWPLPLEPQVVSILVTLLQDKRSPAGATPNRVTASGTIHPGTLEDLDVAHRYATPTCRLNHY
jgi:hypothetical protein